MIKKKNNNFVIYLIISLIIIGGIIFLVWFLKKKNTSATSSVTPPIVVPIPPPPSLEDTTFYNCGGSKPLTTLLNSNNNTKWTFINGMYSHTNLINTLLTNGTVINGTLTNSTIQLSYYLTGLSGNSIVLRNIYGNNVGLTPNSDIKPLKEDDQAYTRQVVLTNNPNTNFYETTPFIPTLYSQKYFTLLPSNCTSGNQTRSQNMNVNNYTLTCIDTNDNTIMKDITIYKENDFTYPRNLNEIFNKGTVTLNQVIASSLINIKNLCYPINDCVDGSILPIYVEVIGDIDITFIKPVNNNVILSLDPNDITFYNLNPNTTPPNTTRAPRRRLDQDQQYIDDYNSIIGSSRNGRKLGISQILYGFQLDEGLVAYFFSAGESLAKSIDSAEFIASTLADGVAVVQAGVEAVVATGNSVFFLVAASAAAVYGLIYNIYTGVFTLTRDGYYVESNIPDPDITIDNFPLPTTGPNPLIPKVLVRRKFDLINNINVYTLSSNKSFFMTFTGDTPNPINLYTVNNKTGAELQYLLMVLKNTLYVIPGKDIPPLPLNYYYDNGIYNNLSDVDQGVKCARVFFGSEIAALVDFFGKPLIPYIAGLPGLLPQPPSCDAYPLLLTLPVVNAKSTSASDQQFKGQMYTNTETNKKPNCCPPGISSITDVMKPESSLLTPIPGPDIIPALFKDIDIPSIFGNTELLNFQNIFSSFPNTSFSMIPFDDKGCVDESKRYNIPVAFNNIISKIIPGNFGPMQTVAIQLNQGQHLMNFSIEVWDKLNNMPFTYILNTITSAQGNFDLKVTLPDFSEVANCFVRTDPNVLGKFQSFITIGTSIIENIWKNSDSTETTTPPPTTPTPLPTPTPDQLATLPRISNSKCPQQPSTTLPAYYTSDFMKKNPDNSNPINSNYMQPSNPPTEDETNLIIALEGATITYNYDPLCPEGFIATKTNGSTFTNTCVAEVSPCPPVIKCVYNTSNTVGGNNNCGGFLTLRYITDIGIQKPYGSGYPIQWLLVNNVIDPTISVGQYNVVPNTDGSYTFQEITRSVLYPSFKFKTDSKNQVIQTTEKIKLSPSYIIKTGSIFSLDPMTNYYVYVNNPGIYIKPIDNKSYVNDNQNCGYSGNVCGDGKICCGQKCIDSSISTLDPDGVHNMCYNTCDPGFIDSGSQCISRQFVYSDGTCKPGYIDCIPQPEVFGTGDGYNYTRSQAEEVCKSYGTTLSTKQQLIDAQKKGAQWCSTGWVIDDNTNAYYPSQLGTDIGCGGGASDIIYGAPPKGLAAVNCYGKKPVTGMREFNEIQHKYSSSCSVDDCIVAPPCPLTLYDLNPDSTSPQTNWLFNYPSNEIGKNIFYNGIIKINYNTFGGHTATFSCRNCGNNPTELTTILSIHLSEKPSSRFDNIIVTSINTDIVVFNPIIFREMFIFNNQNNNYYLSGSPLIKLTPILCAL